MWLVIFHSENHHVSRPSSCLTNDLCQMATKRLGSRLLSLHRDSDPQAPSHPSSLPRIPSSIDAPNFCSTNACCSLFQNPLCAEKSAKEINMKNSR